MLNKYNLNNSDISEELPLNSAYHIMSKGNNSLMAVLELSLSGYFWEPPIILRTAMEGFATAWDIVHNPKRFDNWRTNKNFQSTKSITNYKEIDEKIGFLYGLLSQYYTHIGPKNSNQAIYMIGNTPIAQNFGFIPPGKEDIRKTEIYMLILVAYISLQTTEICFHEYANTYETVSKIPGELLMKAKVSERHKIFADKALSHFQQLSNNPLEKL
ncbi:MAG: hypothetical protein HOG05_15445 [Bacteroidetes bacterium]|nr:hypothetical protein [Bacteroidota bacterium]